MPSDSSLAAAPTLVTLADAAEAVGKSPHNIRDYIQRGRIGKYDVTGARVARARSGELRVDLGELRRFLARIATDRQRHDRTGLHPELGFHELAERIRTKHVHRLHPYLGKFIPQLAEWFLARAFRAGDLILDPFMGSGTTLVQANEMRMDAIGIDISEFNCRIARVKTAVYDLAAARRDVLDAERRTRRFADTLLDGTAQPVASELLASCRSDYLRAWFAPRALLELLYYRRLIDSGRYRYPDLLRVLLSRSARSSRLVPHDDLATPRAPLPVGVEYRCRKHQRLCRPIDNAITKIHAYSEDTLRRLEAFAAVRSCSEIDVIEGDARTVDLSAVMRGRRIRGIMTSPPYVGQIDYHEQHGYAYELFGIPRRDPLEIGPRSGGKSKRAQREYVEGIAAAFRNVGRHLAADAIAYVVANDRFGLYPEIARRAGWRISGEFHRAVTKRTEAGDDPYQETIFEMQRGGGE